MEVHSDNAQSQSYPKNISLSGLTRRRALVVDQPIPLRIIDRKYA